MKTPLEILAYAISDVGLWTWYAENYPDLLHLEFNRTMLYLEPKEPGQPPSNHIAVQFKQPGAVAILKHREFSLPDNWLAEFRADKLEPFGIDHEQFSFSPPEIKELVAQADSIETIWGSEINEAALLSSPVAMAFWAGEVGLVVLADTIKVKTHKGEVSLDEIVERHNQWWPYWQQYWAVRETDQAMPYDVLCEITIPVKE